MKAKSERMAIIITKIVTTSVGEGTEELDLSYASGGNVKWHSLLENTCSCINVKTGIPWQSCG